MATDDRTSWASKSDAELQAMERDSSLPPAEWQAATDELWRRRQQAGSGGAGAPPKASPAAQSSAPPAPPPRAPQTAPANDPRIARAVSDLRAILVPGETLEAYAVQRRLFALTHRRLLVAATSGRLIVITRGLFGGYTPQDVRWQDIEDANVRVGIFGASLTITSLNQEDLASAGHVIPGMVVTGLRKDQAEAVYRVCQAQWQAWREKRRIRDLDELRARSGGIQFGAPAGTTGQPAGAGADGDAMTRLQRAKEMLDSGLLTDAEFESIKARIVDRL
ncbi:MAG TPA: SHOCT domain-containing protein [Gemmatimonadaceae bacterium]|nr:SHOCT domain-containing protein [Gemmatimonadaceae bacterium]